MAATCGRRHVQREEPPPVSSSPGFLFAIVFVFVLISIRRASDPFVGEDGNERLADRPVSSEIEIPLPPEPPPRLP